MELPEVLGMAMSVLQKEISSALPNARSYGRALTGDTDFSDLVLSHSTTKLLRHTLSVRFLLPSNIVLPALLSEFHRQLDSKVHGVAPGCISDSIPSNDNSGELLYERIDHALFTLSEVQRRVFLLITLCQFEVTVVARILSMPISEVKELLQQSHMLVTDYLASDSMQQAA